MKIDQNRYYHIYNRGNNKNIVFFEPSDYLYFLHQFEKYLFNSCEIYAYCLMPNHFHFFLKVTNKIDFDKKIKNFFISYSRTINLKYNRVGSLFQGRYKVQEIDLAAYFTRVITYIHQNPLIAGLVNHLEDYKYSSYALYLNQKPCMLNKTEIIAWFGHIDGFISDHQILC